MSAQHVGSAIVLDGDGSLAGIFTERDILHALGSDFDAAAHTVQEWMTKDPATIDARPTCRPASTSCSRAASATSRCSTAARSWAWSPRDLSRGNAD